MATMRDMYVNGVLLSDGYAHTATIAGNMAARGTISNRRSLSRVDGVGRSVVGWTVIVNRGDGQQAWATWCHIRGGACASRKWNFMMATREKINHSITTILGKQKLGVGQSQRDVHVSRHMQHHAVCHAHSSAVERNVPNTRNKLRRISLLFEWYTQMQMSQSVYVSQWDISQLSPQQYTMTVLLLFLLRFVAVCMRFFIIDCTAKQATVRREPSTEAMHDTAN